MHPLFPTCLRSSKTTDPPSLQTVVFEAPTVENESEHSVYNAVFLVHSSQRFTVDK